MSIAYKRRKRNESRNIRWLSQPESTHLQSKRERKQKARDNAESRKLGFNPVYRSAEMVMDTVKQREQVINRLVIIGCSLVVALCIIDFINIRLQSPHLAIVSLCIGALSLSVSVTALCMIAKLVTNKKPI